MSKTVKFMTGAWREDAAAILDFPETWEVVVVSGKLLPELGTRVIRERILAPIETEPIHVLAKNKKSAVIIVDDLTRPTPTAPLVKITIEELMKGGLLPEQITILMSGGTHQPPPLSEIKKKIGEDILAGICIQTHDCFHKVIFMGKTRNQTPIWINQLVADADLKIGIGGIYPHPAAGFSGGAKILVPATAGYETIQFLHDHFPGSEQRGHDLKNKFRLECEEIARQVGLDFIINVVINQNRKIAGVFAGNFLSAWAEGTVFAKNAYLVEQEPDADIIIADVYPFDTDLQFIHDRGLWPLERATEKADKIALALSTCEIGTHSLFPAKGSFRARLWRRIRYFRWEDLKSLGYRLKALRKLLRNRKKKIIFVSSNIKIEAIKAIYQSGTLFRDWSEARQSLQEKYRAKPVKVIVYRCAPLLITKDAQ